MNPKKLKQLKKRVKKVQQAAKTVPYTQELEGYRELFDDLPAIKYLINNALESDRLLKNGLLPQPLPSLLLPDNIHALVIADKAGVHAVFWVQKIDGDNKRLLLANKRHNFLVL